MDYQQLSPEYPLICSNDNTNTVITVPSSLSPNSYHYTGLPALSSGGFPALTMDDDFQYYGPFDLNPNFSNQQSLHAIILLNGGYEEFDPLYPSLSLADNFQVCTRPSMEISNCSNIIGTHENIKHPLLWSTDHSVLITNGLEETETALLFSQAQHPPLQICNGKQEIEISVENEELNSGDRRPARKIRKQSAPRQLRRYGSSKSQDNNNSVAESLTWEILSQYFYVPIAQAAKELNIGLTLFKKRCRELGVRRWPHRKLMSIKSLIKNVQEMEKDGAADPALSKWTIRNAIEVLENQRKMMEVMPDIQLEAQTKRLRQACFKANYKKRRLVMMNSDAGSAGISGCSKCCESTISSSVYNGTSNLDFEDSGELKWLLFDSFSASECSFLDDCI